MELMSWSAKIGGGCDLCLTGVSNIRGRTGEEHSGSTSHGILKFTRGAVAVFLDMIGEDGGMKSSFAGCFMNGAGNARAGAGAAIPLAGVLAM